MTTNVNPNPESTENQRKKILNYLQSGKGLTALDALQKFGCFRLSARIHELKKSYPIQSQFVQRGKKQVKLYYIKGEDQ